MMLGDRIKKARVNKKLSQDRLSQKLSISKRTLINYEKNNKEPVVSIVKNIAFYCNVSINWLLTGKGKMLTTEALETINNAHIVNSDENFSFSENGIAVSGRNINVSEKLNYDNYNKDIKEVWELLNEYGSKKIIKDLKEKLLKIKALHE